MRRPARTWIGTLLAAVTVVALAACSDSGWEDRCETTPEGVIECGADNRAPAPKIAGELLDGSHYDVTQDRGNVVVVNFWGSWCPPCVAEADDLEKTYQATRDLGVRFIGINVQDMRDKAIAFERGRVSYPSIFDPASRQALNFAIPPSFTPATIVLDREGRIAVVIRKAVRQEMLEPIVRTVAAEQPPQAGPR
ncbi:TlpA disulfide reductase family protein [Micromonospora sonneratiae]|uniref:TlpA family protein disulfide reductase n=1 Tax=Micromonospora sonneratiae TaxID=1184706 RepID=A0ABW3YEF1_9ACTN